MTTLIVASMRKSAGKTSLIVGMAKALGVPIGYMKPFGDRLFYRKKRLWDYDSALIAKAFALEDAPEDLSLGFDHAKLRYMYDAPQIDARLKASLRDISRGREVVFVEAGEDLRFGRSVHLDALSLAQSLGGRLVIVTAGEEGTLCDDLQFLADRVRLEGVSLCGVVVNKVPNLAEFEQTQRAELEAAGIPLLGALPHQPALTHMSLEHLSKSLFARVVAGEAGLGQAAEHIFIGALSVAAARKHPVFAQERKLMITGGDRSDLILAALESDTVGVVLTSNLLPPAQIIAQAQERGIPLLSVPYDTYETAQRIERIEPMLAADDVEKLARLGELVRAHVDLAALTG